MNKTKGSLFSLKSIVLWLVCCVLLLGLLYGLWRGSAEPFGQKNKSPDGKYYIQMYSTFSPKGWLPTAPGSSSDNIDGFIRLYRADGTLLEEEFHTYLVAHEMRWGDGEVHSVGDGPFWQLPE